jgi:glutamate 5-kinase
MNKRIVIKIGSDTISEDSNLNYKRINELAIEICQLHYLGYETLIVSSGAVACGMNRTGITEKTDDVTQKRVLAAIGQCYLMEAWIGAFHPITVGQALLTWKELELEESKLKAKETLCQLLELGYIPIVNENDAIADEEIRFTDNDQLAIKLAKLIHAERLIILTDVDGLFDADPKQDKDAKLIRKVTKVNDALLARVGETKSRCGSGGMLSKVLCAKEGLEQGIVTNIINGSKSGLITALIRASVRFGTEFRA